MAVDHEGTVLGSVSGGCVEGAVYELCRQALVDGKRVVESFGYSDDEAFAVGLTCGGVIDVLVTPVGPRDTPPGAPVTGPPADAPLPRARPSPPQRMTCTGSTRRPLLGRPAD
jgi:xanthine dehydrogenase accessory factor